MRHGQTHIGGAVAGAGEAVQELDPVGLQGGRGTEDPVKFELERGRWALAVGAQCQEIEVAPERGRIAVGLPARCIDGRLGERIDSR